MTPINNVKLDSFDGILLCPQCGEINLHHDEVEVWDRKHEDADTGTHTVVAAKGSVHEDEDMSKNPSPRRQGVSLKFFCEHCCCDEKGNLGGKRFVLEIVQHKGSTYMSWKNEE